MWLQLGATREPGDRLRAPDAVVAGRSAALVLDLGDLPADVHEFYVARRRQPRRSDVRLLVRPTLPVGDWSIRDGLPVCSVPRIVGDLLGRRVDGEAVARICQDAFRQGLLDRPVLDLVTGPHAATYGVHTASAFTDVLLGGGR